MKLPSPLYVILDRSVARGRALPELLDAVLAGGCRLVQLREKALPVSELFPARARSCAGAAGRRGRSSSSMTAPTWRWRSMPTGCTGAGRSPGASPARRLLRPGMILGVSTHDAGQARRALADGADYIAVGSMFPTGTKPGFQLVGPDLIRRVRPEIAVPLVAIGGITEDNCEEVIARGRRRGGGDLRRLRGRRSRDRNPPIPRAARRRRQPPSMRALRAAFPLLVAAASFAAFLPALDGQFLNWDDSVNFLGNPFYRGLGWTQLRWMFTSALMGHYIPVTWLTLGANYLLGGMQPWGYHLVSLLLHAANATLFYFVARRLLAAAGVPAPASAWAAGLRRPALRRASAAGGVGGLDHRAARCGVRVLLPAGGTGLPARGRRGGAAARPLAGAVARGLRRRPALQGRGPAAAPGPAAAGWLPPQAAGARLAAAGAGEAAVCGPLGRRGRRRPARPAPGRGRHQLCPVRPRRPARHGGLQPRLLPAQVPLAGGAVPPLRTARPRRPHRLALCRPPAGGPASDHRPTPGPAQLAGGAGGLELCGADGAARQRPRALRPSARP